MELSGFGKSPIVYI